MKGYSNAGGYGFWCGWDCAKRKMEAGIPPLGASRATKLQQAAAEEKLADAALMKNSKQEEENKWTPLATAGVVTASLIGIGAMVFVIKRARAKRK